MRASDVRRARGRKEGAGEGERDRKGEERNEEGK